MTILKVGDKCEVISKNYRDIKGDLVVIERVVKSKIGYTYHARHEKTGRLVPFLRGSLKLITEAKPDEVYDELKAQRDFFFPRFPTKCPLCGRKGKPILNTFECSNDECRNYRD